jgi:hypothetical protein
MKKSSKIIAMTCVIAFACLIFIGQANAADRKILPGATCQPNKGSQVADFSYHSTDIRNNSTADRWVTCPVVRDNTINTNGIRLARVHVAGAGLYFFYFDNVKNNGTLGYWDSASRVGTGYVDLNINKSFKVTPYAILAKLPKGGKLVGYSVEEY